jgi:TolB-like protein
MEVKTSLAFRDRSNRKDAKKRTVGPRAVRRALAFSLLGVGLVVGLTYFWTSRDTARTIAAKKTHAIAVLPFKTINTDDEYLGPGLADAFIAELTNIKQLTVRPIRASLKYTSTGQDPVEVGRSLRVDTVLEGSLRRVGDSLRMTAQLVRVEDGLRLWEVKSSEEFDNILAVQKAITRTGGAGSGARSQEVAVSEASYRQRCGVSALSQRPLLDKPKDSKGIEASR